MAQVKRFTGAHPPSSRTCKFIATPSGCRRGARCSFSHDLAESSCLPQAQINANLHQSPTERPLLFQWRYMIPKPDCHLATLSDMRLEKFIQGALQLVDADVGTMQETVRLLATDGGLCRIKQIVDRNYNLPADRAKHVCKKLIIPLLQVLTCHNVVASLMLENHLGTIYNFLYGRLGERAVAVFEFIRQVSVFEEGLLQPPNNEIILTALLNTVEWNNNALVNQGLKDIAANLLKTVNIHEQHDPQLMRLERKLAARLDIGNRLPEVPSRQKTATKATFRIPTDLPGHLSTLGPRHDNDHARITKIQIMPTSDEIRASRGEYLPTQNPSQWHVPALEGLLDRHFRLLREDTVGQLRDAIRAELGQAHDRSTQSVARVFTYKNVTIEDLSFSRWKGLKVLIGFDQPDRVTKVDVRTRQDWWQQTKRLQNDALVCLLDGQDNITFFTACEPTKRRENSIDVREHVGNDVKYPTLFQDPVTAFVTLEFVELSDSNVDTITKKLKKGKNKSRRLIEFPGIILPSFQPTLRALQKMTASGELPFSEYLVPQQDYDEPKPPFYSIKQDFRIDLRDVMMNNSNLFYKPGQDFDMDSFKARTQLDEAQANALIMSLNRSLALIQGPPGTGKSFTGVALIKVLLSAKKVAKLGPIICVCYTNHALDQLLEHLLDHGVEQIIRVGSRSKSQRLESCNLRDVAKQINMTREERQERGELWEALVREENEIGQLLSDLSRPDSPKVLKSYLLEHHPFHYGELFQQQDEDGFEIVDHHPGQEIEHWLSQGYGHSSPSYDTMTLLRVSVHDLSNSERRLLHKHWIEDVKDTLRNRLKVALRSYQEQQSQFNRIKDGVDLRCLQSANVIGVTTTGLARQLDLLQKLQVKVLVCEEAGEVLEAHILTALLPSLEHAILIGDHQQLCPHIQNFELSRENSRGQQYSLDMSLFERLVQPPDKKEPSLPFSVLETQRRMHPSISNLVRSTLYPDLQNSPAVEDYPEVPGMRKRLFWLDHHHLEAGAGPDQILATSHSNDFEIDMVVALVTHLVRQTVYAENDIAILTPYLGQMLKIRRRLSRSFEITLTEGDVQEIERQGIEPEDPTVVMPSPQPAKTSLLKALKVSTVDNFQGEEAKVVIISLVRSNAQNKCGFLKTSNRINVLLSRAKHGMYIIGNATTSEHVKMWADVIRLLRAENSIGSQMELQCPRHPNTPILVSKPDDFVILSPEGGCNLKCDRRLSCGHACINKCHSETLHNAVKCLEDCPRSLKGCDHSCPNRCGDICVDKCRVMLHGVDVTLPCGHHRSQLRCWEAQSPTSVVCKDIVARTVPGCEHEVQVPCHIDVKTELCEAACGTTLNCGHVCLRKCSKCKVRLDGIVISEDHDCCQQVCGRPYNACGHSCQDRCHGDKPCPSCSVVCETACRHSKCDKKCSQPCAPCAEETCASACPHQSCKMPCASPCNWLPCSRRCEKTLACGHRCPTLCAEVCPPPQFCQICANAEVQSMTVDYIMMSTYCELDLDKDPCIIPPCGHLQAVSSMDGHMSMSDHYEMDGILCLSIKDKSEPYSMEEVKQCPICRGPLLSLSRYGRIVRRALIDQSSKRFITWARERHLELMHTFHEQQRLLQKSNSTAKSELEMQEVKIRLVGPRAEQIDMINAASKNRYQGLVRLRTSLVRHQRRVATDEQPFKRVWDLVQNARRKRDTNDDMRWDPDSVQVGESLRICSLLMRCELAVITDFLSLAPGSQLLDVSEAKVACLELVDSAKEAHQPLQATEGHIYLARFCALQRASVAVNEIDELVRSGKRHIEEARRICKENPGSTQLVAGEVDEVEKMLREATFYSEMKDEEWIEVMAAMRRAWIGTGHWYTCENGHPFAVGECGGPMEETKCPECGSPVGGHDHRAARGVQHAVDLERRFGGIHLGS